MSIKKHNSPTNKDSTSKLQSKIKRNAFLSILLLVIIAGLFLLINPLFNIYNTNSLNKSTAKAYQSLNKTSEPKNDLSNWVYDDQHTKNLVLVLYNPECSSCQKNVDYATTIVNRFKNKKDTTVILLKSPDETKDNIIFQDNFELPDSKGGPQLILYKVNEQNNKKYKPVNTVKISNSVSNAKTLEKILDSLSNK